MLEKYLEELDEWLEENVDLEDRFTYLLNMNVRLERHIEGKLRELSSGICDIKQNLKEIGV